VPIVLGGAIKPGNLTIKRAVRGWKSSAANVGKRKAPTNVEANLSMVEKTIEGDGPLDGVRQGRTVRQAQALLSFALVA
jgi:hypothetical protein